MKNILIILSLGFITMACSYFGVFDTSHAIDRGEWDCNKAYRFEYQSDDTVNSKDVFINLRHTGQYKYNNIYFFVTTQAPDGKTIKDTVDFTFADTHGKWAGTGIGDMYDVRLVLRQHVTFGQHGKYVFMMSHGMRDPILKDITDIGIRIENSK